MRSATTPTTPGGRIYSVSQTISDHPSRRIPQSHHIPLLADYISNYQLYTLSSAHSPSRPKFPSAQFIVGSSSHSQNGHSVFPHNQAPKPLPQPPPSPNLQLQTQPRHHSSNHRAFSSHHLLHLVRLPGLAKARPRRPSIQLLRLSSLSPPPTSKSFPFRHFIHLQRSDSEENWPSRGESFLEK